MLWDKEYISQSALKMKENKERSKAKIIIRVVVTVLFIFAVVFIPAGTFHWPEAWIFLVLYFVFVTAALFG